MRTISQCFGISAARAQADMDLSLSGGNDRWHASSSMTLLLAVGATTEAAPEAAHAPGAEDAEAAREDAASPPEAMAEDAEAQGEATAATEALLGKPRLFLYSSRNPKGSDPKSSSSSPEVDMGARQVRAPGCGKRARGCSDVVGVRKALCGKRCKLRSARAEMAT